MTNGHHDAVSMFGHGRSGYATCAALQSQFMTFLSKPPHVQSLQAIALGKRPHIIVGTPGRVVDHLSNTKVTRVVPMERTIEPVVQKLD